MGMMVFHWQSERKSKMGCRRKGRTFMRVLERAPIDHVFFSDSETYLKFIESHCV